jgi:hypothetical protein
MTPKSTFIPPQQYVALVGQAKRGMREKKEKDNK